jgi:hypothetical protein
MVSKKIVTLGALLALDGSLDTPPENLVSAPGSDLDSKVISGNQANEQSNAIPRPDGSEAIHYILSCTLDILSCTLGSVHRHAAHHAQPSTVAELIPTMLGS